VRPLRYLAAARRDIAEIYAYIENRSGSAQAAERFVQRLRAQCRHLAELPTVLGRLRPELRPGFRTFPFSGYIIVLRYTTDALEIVNIVEGHRDIGAMFRKNDQ
jgi:toxin ParE1/3/4